MTTATVGRVARVGIGMAAYFSPRRYRSFEPAGRARRHVSRCRSMWVQRDITLKPRPRGFHLVTREVVGELAEIARVRTGLLHVHIQHTSASLTLNENASS